MMIGTEAPGITEQSALPQEQWPAHSLLIWVQFVIQFCRNWFHGKECKNARYTTGTPKVVFMVQHCWSIKGLWGEKFVVYSVDKWISLLCAHCQTSSSHFTCPGENGIDLASLSQVRVVANAAKPSEFHTHGSELAPDGLSFLLIHDRTDI